MGKPFSRMQIYDIIEALLEKARASMRLDCMNWGSNESSSRFVATITWSFMVVQQLQQLQHNPY